MIRCTRTAISHAAEILAVNSNCHIPSFFGPETAGQAHFIQKILYKIADGLFAPSNQSNSDAFHPMYEKRNKMDKYNATDGPCGI